MPTAWAAIPARLRSNVRIADSQAIADLADPVRIGHASAVEGELGGGRAADAHLVLDARPCVKPGVPCSTTKQVRWRWPRTASGSASVTAKTVTTSATSPWLMKRFSPLMRQPSPSRRALRPRGSPRPSPRLGLRQGEGGQGSAGGEVGNPARGFCSGVPASEQRQGTERLDGQDEPARGAGAADLLDRQADREQVGAQAAVLDRERQREDVVLSEQLDHVPRELAALVDRGGTRRDALVREHANGVSEVALLVAQVEGHRAAPRITAPS